ncbi:MAG: endonuclease/exonuclease/phosphatase family protein [Candidatus Cryptobacteroides sp.]
MKLKRLLFFAAALVLAISCAKQPETELKVISYNIRLASANDGENNWENRRPASIAMLQEQDPDIFGLQEALGRQVKYLSENLPKYKSVGVGRDDGALKGERMTIFYDTTRVALLDWGTYWLSETPDVPSFGWGAACRRTATWTKLHHISTGKDFFYVNTHLDHVSAEARKNGLALIVREIEKMNPDGYPMLLTGDFNIPPASDNLVELDKIMTSARKGAIDSDGKGSFNGWGKYGNSDSAPTWDGPVETSPMLIDYIYYSSFSKCLKFRVLDGEYAGVKYISDHYPVMAEFRF